MDGMVLEIDAVEGEGQRLQGLVPLIGFQFTLPNGDAMPAHLCQLPLLPYVTFPVPVDFPCPKLHVGPRHLKVLASLMPMPEATVDEDTRAVLAKYNVGMPGQPRIVEPVAKSPPSQVFAHKQLRLRVLGADRGHDVMPVLWSSCKRHGYYFL
jgi:hypothetical protein